MNALKQYLTYPCTGPEVSLHNHSCWSDGKDTTAEMCRAARAAGVTVFGLSDHYVAHPEPSCMPVSWSMDLSKLDDYVEELVKLKKEVNDEHFTLFAGLEVDFFYDNIDDVLAKLSGYPLDYLIGSVHYVGKFPIDHSADNWRDLSEEENDLVCRRYWEKVYATAACGRFTFLGHLDLTKKFRMVRDPGRYLPAAIKVLDCAAAKGTPIELNTAGWFKPCEEAYPGPDILREANLRKVPIVINADAHSAAHITRSFPEARALLREAGYPV